jgi:hypothetical protein
VAANEGDPPAGCGERGELRPHRLAVGAVVQPAASHNQRRDALGVQQAHIFHLAGRVAVAVAERDQPARAAGNLQDAARDLGKV